MLQILKYSQVIHCVNCVDNSTCIHYEDVLPKVNGLYYKSCSKFYRETVLNKKNTEKTNLYSVLCWITYKRYMFQGHMNNYVRDFRERVKALCLKKDCNKFLHVNEVLKSDILNVHKTCIHANCQLFEHLFNKQFLIYKSHYCFSYSLSFTY